MIRPSEQRRISEEWREATVQGGGWQGRRVSARCHDGTSDLTVFAVFTLVVLADPSTATMDLEDDGDGQDPCLKI
jgi:hypothetical protein